MQLHCNLEANNFACVFALGTDCYAIEGLGWSERRGLYFPLKHFRGGRTF